MMYNSVVTVRNSYGDISTIRSMYAIDKKQAQARAEKWAEYSRLRGHNEILSVRIEPDRG